MSNKLLTVIVPVRHEAALLEETVLSLAAINGREQLEVLIVTDGSGGEAFSAASHLRRTYPGLVRVIDRDMDSRAAAINLGIARAAGAYFKILAAGDEVDSAGFEQLLQFLQTTDADEVISPYTAVFEDADEQEIRYFDETELVPELAYGYEAFLEAIETLPALPSLTIKSSVWKDHSIALDEAALFAELDYAVLPAPFVKTVGYTETAVCRQHISSGPADELSTWGASERTAASLMDFYQSLSLPPVLSRLVGESVRSRLSVVGVG